MAKRNYVYLSNDAFTGDTMGTYFSDEFKTKYITEVQTGIFKINANYGTFVGQASGNTYPVEEIGLREEGDGLFNGAATWDISGLEAIYLDLSIPETVKRINRLGAYNFRKLNGYETYLAGLLPLTIPETVDEIEDTAFSGFEMLYVETPSKYSNLLSIGAKYINPYSYGASNVFYKDSSHTILYGFIEDYIQDSDWISDGVMTIPDTITEIYSFNGEFKQSYNIRWEAPLSNLTKVVIPTTITKIEAKITVYSDTTTAFSYNGVDYTYAGTGNNDSFTDLNNVLDTAGITTDGLLDIQSF